MIAVQIQYITELGNKVLQRGSFPAKGRKPEKVAYNWWRELKKEMNVEIKMEKVMIDGEDKTEEVKEMEKAPLK